MKTNKRNQVVVPEKAALKAPKDKLFTGVLVAAILLTTVIVHSNSLNNGFVKWDDDKYVYNNEDIRQLDGQSILKIFYHYLSKNVPADYND